MYTTKIYYFLDKVAETIIGSFEAKSDAMAKRFLDNFDYDKAKLSKKDCSVVCYVPEISHLETYEEVINSKFGKDCSELINQVVFDFEGTSNDN